MEDPALLAEGKSSILEKIDAGRFSELLSTQNNDSTSFTFENAIDLSSDSSANKNKVENEEKETQHTEETTIFVEESESSFRRWGNQIPQVARGLDVQRSVLAIKPGFYFSSHVDGNYCSAFDQYGPSKCKFSWGDRVKGGFSYIGVTLGRMDVVRADLTAKSAFSVPFTFKCHLCEEECPITIPIVNKDFIIPPLATCDELSTMNNIEVVIDNLISPLGGVPLTVSGNLFLERVMSYYQSDNILQMQINAILGI